jgi:hypothetical protein
MQQKYAKDGLVVVTVSLELWMADAKHPKKEMEERARTFLRRHNVNFINLILDEPEEAAREKLRLDSAPCVYVFSREGKWRRLTNQDREEVTPAVIDPLVEKLLKAR